jgi:RNA polymerase sigma-70 factor (sigma-E family)
VDDELLTRFVQRRWDGLCRLAYLLTGSSSHASDVVQTALEKTLSAGVTVESEAQLEVYVRKAIVSVAASWRQRVRARQSDRPVPDVAQPRDLPEQVDDRDQLVRALRQLPPRQRMVIVLRYYQDLTEADTATALGISVGTVKSQTAKALTALRALVPTVDAPVLGGAHEPR